MFKDKTILITGGTGSWGYELTKLIKDAKKIIIFSRGELAQVNMERYFKRKEIEFVIGDIRDKEAVDSVMSKKIDIVIHLAALKHVPVCENYPQEAIKTNILGTTNLVNAAIKYKVKKFIDVSTDKAVSPNNLYGYTKAVGEKIVIQANNLTYNTDFVCVRGGNVLGSNGSVVPLFIDQIKKYNKITITDNSMTRFFLTLREAILLLFQAIENSYGGEIFVMNMPSFYIADIANVLVEKYGDSDTIVEEIGIREGEKIDEILISEHESSRSYIFNKNFYIILPDLKLNRFCQDYDRTLVKVNFKKFTSNTNIKTAKHIIKLLEKGGY